MAKDNPFGKSAGAPKKNPMSKGMLPGIAKGGPTNGKSMGGMAPTMAVAAVPKKMPKKY